jgi:tetratricopeptide (TPR) repeat protein
VRQLRRLRALSMGSKSAMALCLLCVSLSHTMPASAQTIWERIAHPADGARDDLAAGLALERAGDIEGALERYRDVGLGADTESARLYEQRALLVRPEETVALTEEAVSDVPSVYRSQQLFFRSLALIELRDLEQAISVLREATRFQADLPHAHLYLSNLAECYSAQGDHAMAAVYFQQALNRDPGYLPARLGLAAAALRSGDASAFLYQLARTGSVSRTISVLRTSVPYTIVDGERSLYEAILFLAHGDPENAARALAQHRASDAAGLTEREHLDALQERIGEPWFTVSNVEFPDCLVGWASAVRNGRIAVWCQDGSLRLHSIEDGVPTLLDNWFVGHNGEAFAMHEDGTIINVEWGNRQLRHYILGEPEPTLRAAPSSVPVESTRFFSSDGRIMWSHTAEGQAAHAWRIDSNEPPLVVSLASAMWGHNYASSPRGDRFVMVTNTDHVVISQDGSVHSYPHSAANPYGTTVLVNDQPGLRVTIGETQLQWRDESFDLLQRWRVPNGGYIGTATMGDTDVVVTWLGTSVRILTGRPVLAGG